MILVVGGAGWMGKFMQGDLLNKKEHRYHLSKNPIGTVMHFAAFACVIQTALQRHEDLHRRLNSKVCKYFKLSLFRV